MWNSMAMSKARQARDKKKWWWGDRNEGIKTNTNVQCITNWCTCKRQRKLPNKHTAPGTHTQKEKAQIHKSTIFL